MNKLTVAVAVAAACLGASGAAYAASNDAHEAAHHRVLHFTDQQTQNATIGAPTADSLLGLRFVGADDLFDGSRLVGHLGRSCEAVADLGEQGATFQCIATLTLDDGIITTQALPTFTPDGLEDFDAAITGGTGAYRHARGFVAVDTITDTESRLTVDLR
jgi:hypothetical protein